MTKAGHSNAYNIRVQTMKHCPPVCLLFEGCEMQSTFQKALLGPKVCAWYTSIYTHGIILIIVINDEDYIISLS